METFLTVLVTFIAGAGAGLGTGFAGMSAAVVIAPMLVTFLGVDHYMAVGIALASDVLASALSAATYGKHKNLDLKHSLIMLCTAILFTVGGTYLAKLVTAGLSFGERTMSGISLVMTFFMGIKFLVKPVMTTKETMLDVSKKRHIIGSVLCGAAVGLVCGFVGAGGGILMLVLLTLVLGYELKTAIGTSVFMMTFTAFVGSMSHFLIGGAPDWLILGLCVGFTLVWSGVAAFIANRVKPRTLNIVLGIILLLFAAVMTVFYLINLLA